MNAGRDVERLIADWFVEEAVLRAPDRVLDAAGRVVDRTRQRRFGAAWRVIPMSAPLRLAAAAVIGVLAIGGAFFLIGRIGQSNIGGPNPSASPSTSRSPSALPSPSQTSTVTTLPDGQLPAGTYTFEPFGSGPGLDSTCMQPPPSGCVDPGTPASMQLTLTVPDGWESVGLGVWTDSNAPPGGAGLSFNRGAWLFSDPCRKNEENPDIPVGPTVDDFVNALASHPLLDTTTPVDVTVDGYAGKALDLQVPADILLCTVYRPWEPGIYAQGPGHLWHLRVIDVEGDRIVIQSMEYAGTDSQRRAELGAMVDSIQIEP